MEVCWANFVQKEKGVKEILMNVISKAHLTAAKAHSALLCVTHGFSKPCLFSLMKSFTE